MTSHYLFLTGCDSKSIVERLENLQDDRSYTEIYVSMIRIDDAVAAAIRSAFLARLDRPWAGVHLAHCSGHVGQVVYDALALGAVEKLSLMPDSSPIDNENSCLDALTRGLQQNRSVQSLVMRVSLYQALAEALAEGLRPMENHRNPLRQLSVLLSTPDQQALATLAKGIPAGTTLRSLHLQRCGMEDGYVANGLVRHLDDQNRIYPSSSQVSVTLSVQGMALQGKGVMALVSLIASNSSSLTQLDLSNQPQILGSAAQLYSSRNNMADGNSTDDEDDYFWDDEEDELEEDNYYYVDTSRYNMSAVSFIVSSLPSNTNLRVLDLSSNDLTEADVTSIAVALTENTTLRELRMVSCEISDSGMRRLASFLPKWKGLRRLSLYGNPVSRAALRALIKAVPKNLHLEHLVLPEAVPEQKTKRKSDALAAANIDYCLLLNRGGRHLIHQQHSVNVALWPKIIERTQAAFQMDGEGKRGFGTEDESNKALPPSISPSSAGPNAVYNIIRQGPAALHL